MEGRVYCDTLQICDDYRVAMNIQQVSDDLAIAFQGCFSKYTNTDISFVTVDIGTTSSKNGGSGKSILEKIITIEGSAGLMNVLTVLIFFILSIAAGVAFFYKRGKIKLFAKQKRKRKDIKFWKMFGFAFQIQNLGYFAVKFRIFS